MTYSAKTLLSLAGLGLITSLTACTAAQNNAGADMQAANAPIVKTSKVSAAVNFSSDFDGTLKPGETKVIRVTVTDNYPSGTLTVSVIPDENLSVFPDNAPFVFSMEGDQSHSFELSVSAKSQGHHHLNLNGIAEFGNGQVARVSHSFAMRSGTALEKTAAPTQNNDDKTNSDGVITMDAEEEIIQK